MCANELYNWEGAFYRGNHDFSSLFEQKLRVRVSSVCLNEEVLVVGSQSGSDTGMVSHGLSEAVESFVLGVVGHSEIAVVLKDEETVNKREEVDVCKSQAVAEHEGTTILS